MNLIPNDPKIVTVQDLSPLLVALLRALIFAAIGAVSGLVAVLQTNGDASGHHLVVGAIIGGGLAFAGRASEGLVDENRAVTLDSSAPVRDAIINNGTGGQ